MQTMNIIPCSLYNEHAQSVNINRIHISSLKLYGLQQMINAFIKALCLCSPTGGSKFTVYHDLCKQPYARVIRIPVVGTKISEICNFWSNDGQHLAILWCHYFTTAYHFLRNGFSLHQHSVPLGKPSVTW